MSFISRALIIITVVAIIGVGAPAVAATTFAKGLGDATGPLVVAGIAASYFGSGEHAKADAARTADAAMIALGTAELLKPNLKVSDGGSVHTFPSGHTALAFATATSLAATHPKHRWLYFAGAALVGWSRVESDAHTWRDVMGGAALGFGAGKWSVGSRDGLLIGRVYKF